MSAYQPITVAPGISSPFTRPSPSVPCAPDSATQLLTFLSSIEGRFSPFTLKQNEILDRSRFSVPSKNNCHLSPCCGSPTARAAACAGFTLGCASGLIGGAAPAAGLAHWGVVSLSALCSGLANGSGTLLSTLESLQRDKRQDVLNEINREWRAAANHLISEFLHARTTLAKSSWQDLAYQILNRADALRADFEAKSLETRENLEILLQAARYVVKGHVVSVGDGSTLNEHTLTGQFPIDEGLRNQIATFDSPSNDEFEMYRQRQEALMEHCNQMIAELRHELEATKQKVQELEGARKQD